MEKIKKNSQEEEQQFKEFKQNFENCFDYTDENKQKQSLEYISNLVGVKVNKIGSGNNYRYGYYLYCNKLEITDEKNINIELSEFFAESANPKEYKALYTNLCKIKEIISNENLNEKKKNDKIKKINDNINEIARKNFVLHSASVGRIYGEIITSVINSIDSNFWGYKRECGIKYSESDCGYVYSNLTCKDILNHLKKYLDDKYYNEIYEVRKYLDYCSGMFIDIICYDEDED